MVLTHSSVCPTWRYKIIYMFPKISRSVPHDSDRKCLPQDMSQFYIWKVTGYFAGNGKSRERRQKDRPLPIASIIS